MIARLLISPSLVCRGQEVKKILAQIGLTNPHPDLLYYPSDTKLGIEQAREIKKHFSFKPYLAKGKAVVLEDASNLTIEAQNALLKTLEELPENAIFILGADSDSRLLPTVVSRCQIEFLTTNYQLPTTNYSEDVEKLLAAGIEERFEYVEKLKDREEFLHFLISYFHKKLPSNSEFVKELLTAEEWQKQNVNIRGILEYLMLVIPSKI